MKIIKTHNAKRGMVYQLIVMDHKIPKSCVWATPDGQRVAVCLMRKDRNGEMVISRMMSWQEKMSWIMMVVFDIKNVAKALDIKPVEV